MTSKAKEVLNKPYARRLVPDETGGFVASIHEFPGCIAEGETPVEALDNLERAASAWIESAITTGYPVRDPVSFYGYSGKIALRMPRGLHKQVAELADLQDCSVNQLLVTAISQYIGGSQGLSQITEVIRSELRSIVSEGIVFLSQNGPYSFTFSIQPQHPAEYVGGMTIDGSTAERTFSIGTVPQPNAALLVS